MNLLMTSATGRFKSDGTVGVTRNVSQDKLVDDFGNGTFVAGRRRNVIAILLDTVDAIGNADAESRRSL